MINKKKTGSFYTPQVIVDFIVGYLSHKFRNQQVSVLEPSAGDGRFVNAIYQNHFFRNNILSCVAVEKNKKELNKIKINLPSLQLVQDDFLKYQVAKNNTFSLVIGNPPYIKKNHLKEEQINLCEKIHSESELSSDAIRNIWTAFLLRGIKYLSDDGILAFVLPSELLQVKFSGEIREFLKVNFQRTEIFTFDDLLFDCKGQDTVLLFGYKLSTEPGQFYTHIKKISQLQLNEFVLVQNTALSATDTKWSHHSLTSDELNFLHNLKGSLKTINDYCDSKPGIVTAANKFFIVDKITELSYGLTQYLRPIIQKGLFVNGSVVFNKDDYRELIRAGKPAKILSFKDEDVDSLPDIVKQYLEMGSTDDLPCRYKCKQRKHWFVVPNISTIPEGFFFKRSHLYPKLLRNDARVLVTDSAYKIEMRKGFKIENFIFSFYNSLTLAFSELDGRYYGGGVLELTPNEFKNLPIPNITIETDKFIDFVSRFENKDDISEVLKDSDIDILHASLKLSLEDSERVKFIYKKLISKRFRM